MDEHTMGKAMALVMDGYGCIEVDVDAIRSLNEVRTEEDRIPEAFAGRYVGQCVGTALVHLGYTDVVRHAKGIVEGVATLAPGDYGGAVDVGDAVDGHAVDGCTGDLVEMVYDEWAGCIGEEDAAQRVNEAAAVAKRYVAHHGIEVWRGGAAQAPQGRIRGTFSG